MKCLKNVQRGVFCTRHLHAIPSWYVHTITHMILKVHLSILSLTFLKVLFARAGGFAEDYRSKASFCCCRIINHEPVGTVICLLCRGVSYGFSGRISMWSGFHVLSDCGHRLRSLSRNNLALRFWPWQDASPDPHPPQSPGLSNLLPSTVQICWLVHRILIFFCPLMRKYDVFDIPSMYSHRITRLLSSGICCAWLHKCLISTIAIPST